MSGNDLINMIALYVEAIPSLFQMYGSGLVLLILIMCMMFVSGAFSFLIRMVFSVLSFRPSQAQM